MIQKRAPHNREALATCFLVVLYTAACSVVPVFTKTVGTTAVIVSGAYRALDKVDADKIAEAKAVAKAGKPDEAKLMLDAWLPKYNAARTAVDVASASVESAVAFLPALKLGLSNAKRDAMLWVVTLLKAGAGVVKACADIGLKIPGVNF